MIRQEDVVQTGDILLTKRLLFDFKPHADSVDCMKYHRWLYAEGTLRQVFLKC